jgi:uncharacterized membrane protein (DUF2068 family)
VDTRSTRAGLRAVAVYEIVKGVGVLAAGFGILTLLHKDAGDVAEFWVRKMHLNPEGHISRAFLEAAEKVTDAKVWAAAIGGLAYSTVRFVEGYGLWHARVWAEWFALLSGALYLPWEIYEIIVHPVAWKWAVFVLNVAIVLYMLYVRVRASVAVED